MKRSIAALLLLAMFGRGAEAGLVGYWPFDGDVLDASGTGNDGELIGGAFTNSVPSVLGAGQSISFQDPTEYVLVDADPSLNSNQFTLSMFVNDQEQFDGINRLTSRQSDSFETGIDKVFGTDSISFYSPAAGWVTTSEIPDGDSWQHWAFVADGEMMTVFRDGGVVYGPEPFTASPVGFMHIGNRWNGAEGFFGLMDDVALWNVPLSEDAITQLASGAKTPLQIESPDVELPPTPVFSVISNIDTWTLSTESVDGGDTVEWDPSADPLPPAIDTYTEEPLATDPAIVGHIDAAAVALSVQGITADADTHYYRTTFNLTGASGLTAEMKLAVDNGAQVYINGELIATEVSFVTENWAFPLPSVDFATDGTLTSTKFDDVANTFAGWIEGENEIVLAVRNPFSETSPAGGFAFRLDFFGDGLRGDFNGDGKVDVDDVNALNIAIRDNSGDTALDLNSDARVDVADLDVMIMDILGTWLGDANLDGEFNSSDLVTVFSAGKYETANDATWTEGDWDGDGKFGSSDLVRAFMDGGYEQGTRAAVAAVPEPTSLSLLLFGLAAVCGSVVRRR
ncbi:MAG: PEP-CTERM sorting domain-containing protein [Planctomycetales bacterium]|nr:PEP-CTERM sorting domain-containing protein [Planctomycetales bacterium]